ncbi:MAG: hypothetical protein NVSMB2_14070 [Chloroflexota bacterium]
MLPADIRAMVAALPDATEGAHHGHPDFRVQNKIFATLSEREDRVNLRLPRPEALALVAERPDAYRIVADRDPFSWISAPLLAAEPDQISDLLERACTLRQATSSQRAVRPRRAHSTH